MNMDAVIGCDAVDAGSGETNTWLRLRAVSGAIRTIPWSSVKLAGMGGNHEGHIQIQGITERVTPLFATHDSLWIVYANGGFAQAMLEKSHPKRDAILAAFAAQLGARWRGDQLEQNALMDVMFHVPVAAMSGLPKLMTIMIVVMAIMFLLAVAAIYFARHAG
jgi:hypothetical protein